MEEKGRILLIGGSGIDLEGNVIPGSNARIRNRYLKKAAQELIGKYC